MVTIASPAVPSAVPRVRFAADARLPSRFGDFRVFAFECLEDGQDYGVVVQGDVVGAENVPVRLHSECFTGEVLHSQRCECAGQLEYALDAVNAAGRGVVVYLRQEGRGIGLANKLRAYALQAMGADTVDANRLLGLPDDARRYDAAAAILKHLGVKSVRLLTNNPAKARALEALGIHVAQTLPVLVASNPIALSYLRTKGERMEHVVPETA